MLKEKARRKLALAYVRLNLRMLNCNMDFGKRLSQLMESKNIKPKELADMIEATPSFISQLRSGHRKPGREVLMKLSRALDATIDQLTTESNVEIPETKKTKQIPVISWVQAGK